MRSISARSPLTLTLASLLNGLCLLLLLGAWGPAGAANGVFEISHACAGVSPTGCFPGDGPGYPVTITQPGSYALTGNLDVTFDQTAIVIEGINVTLDLNGFRINGLYGGTGAGVLVLANNAEVRNGTIRSFSTGVKIASGVSGGRLISLRIVENRIDGVDANGNSDNRIESCTIRVNNGSGLFLKSSTTLILDTTVQANNIGVRLDDATATLRSNIISANVANDFVLVGTPTIVQLGPNQCGNDTTCP